jgi:hypothetical protein
VPDVTDRLSSWKEIAAYLGRDVRTVQRWERTQGLPVHRHHHNRLSTAYAYKSELDAWWHNRPSGNGSEDGGASDDDGSEIARNPVSPAGEPPLTSDHAGRRATRRWVAAGASLVLTAAIAVLVWQVAREGRTAEPAVSLAADDWVLVTAFDNHSGEPVFDGTLEYVLRQQLAASPTVRVASPDRVRDALQLMRRPLDTRVDVARSALVMGPFACSSPVVSTRWAAGTT